MTVPPSCCMRRISPVMASWPASRNLSVPRPMTGSFSPSRGWAFVMRPDCEAATVTAERSQRGCAHGKAGQQSAAPAPVRVVNHLAHVIRHTVR